jgi:hypothetical protein
MATSNKYLCTTFLLFVVGTMAAQANGQGKIRLKDYQWKNRLILAFSLIDTMPMRQREMREKSQQR